MGPYSKKPPSIFRFCFSGLLGTFQLYAFIGGVVAEVCMSDGFQMPGFEAREPGHQVYWMTSVWHRSLPISTIFCLVHLYIVLNLPCGGGPTGIFLIAASYFMHKVLRIYP